MNTQSHEFDDLLTITTRMSSPEMARVLADVVMEREAQDAKFGKSNQSDFVWMTVLSEEMGEAAEAALHKKFGGDKADGLRDELIQVAAVAIAWVENLDRDNPPKKRVKRDNVFIR